MEYAPIASAPEETQSATIASKLNWLRAGVLGANDGVVSTASIIFGVAGAAAAHATVVLAGIAAIAAGAMSMAVGEYVSVSSQRDVERAELAREKEELAKNPKAQLGELQTLLEGQGIEPKLARQVAVQLHEQDALGAHARIELGIDPEAVVNPWHAAAASMIAFTIGGVIPLIGILLGQSTQALWTSGAMVILALALSGLISAKLGGTGVASSVARTVAGGILGMAITYGVGHLAGIAV